MEIRLHVGLKETLKPSLINWKCICTKVFISEHTSRLKVFVFVWPYCLGSWSGLETNNCLVALSWGWGCLAGQNWILCIVCSNQKNVACSWAVWQCHIIPSMDYPALEWQTSSVHWILFRRGNTTTKWSFWLEEYIEESSRTLHPFVQTKTVICSMLAGFLQLWLSPQWPWPLACPVTACCLRHLLAVDVSTPGPTLQTKLSTSVKQLGMFILRVWLVLCAKMVDFTQSPTQGLSSATAPAGSCMLEWSVPNNMVIVLNLLSCCNLGWQEFSLDHALFFWFLSVVATTRETLAATQMATTVWSNLCSQTCSHCCVEELALPMRTIQLSGEMLSTNGATSAELREAEAAHRTHSSCRLFKAVPTTPCICRELHSLRQDCAINIWSVRLSVTPLRQSGQAKAALYCGATHSGGQLWGRAPPGQNPHTTWRFLSS